MRLSYDLVTDGNRGVFTISDKRWSGSPKMAVMTRYEMVDLHWQLCAKGFRLAKVEKLSSRAFSAMVNKRDAIGGSL